MSLDIDPEGNMIAMIDQRGTCLIAGLRTDEEIGCFRIGEQFSNGKTAKLSLNFDAVRQI